MSLYFDLFWIWNLRGLWEWGFRPSEWRVSYSSLMFVSLWKKMVLGEWRLSHVLVFRMKKNLFSLPLKERNKEEIENNFNLNLWVIMIFFFGVRDSNFVPCIFYAFSLPTNWTKLTRTSNNDLARRKSVSRDEIRAPNYCIIMKWNYKKLVGNFPANTFFYDL